MTGRASLPPYAYDWAGGNIAGLQALDAECARVATTLAGTDQALSRQVAQVASDGGWRGAAASAFTAAWDKDSAAGAQLAQAWEKIGAIADSLALNLATLENALEAAADQLEKQGIPVDPANGTPLPDSLITGSADPAPQALAGRAKLASAYATYRAQILGQASVARAVAATDLDAITESLLPPEADWGDVVNGLDTARGLWAVPTTYRRGLETELAQAEKDVDLTQRAAWEDLIPARRLQGNAARLDPKIKAEAAEALEERARLEGRLSASPPEDPISMTADGDAAGLGLAGLAGGAVRSIPFIGATAGAAITIYEDRERGESWGHAVADGVVSDGAALGAGLVIGAAIGGGSVAAIAAGVVGGGLVAIGVGDFVHNVFQENWSADWQQYGVLDGTVHGVADAAANTGHDLVHLADDLNPF